MIRIEEKRYKQTALTILKFRSHATRITRDIEDIFLLSQGATLYFILLKKTGYSIDFLIIGNSSPNAFYASLFSTGE